MATANQKAGHEVAKPDQDGFASAALTKVLAWGVDGLGPMKGARETAEEHLAQHTDVERAIDQLVKTHTRMVAATGFITGLGGLASMPVTLPTDVTTFYALSARCAGAVAHLRGYDLDSDEVRSVILATLLGAAGVALLKEIGVDLGKKTALAALRKLPGKALIEINKKVGFRLFTKFGTKGVINLGKAVPLVGGGVGAAMNGTGMRTTGRYAKANFPTGGAEDGPVSI